MSEENGDKEGFALVISGKYLVSMLKVIIVGERKFLYFHELYVKYMLYLIMINKPIISTLIFLKNDLNIFCLRCVFIFLFATNIKFFEKPYFKDRKVILNPLKVFL